MKILVVDDEESIRNCLKGLLTSWDHEVILAQSGEEGVEIFRRSPEFGLVITDLSMKNMDGIQMTKVILAISPMTRIWMASGNYFGSTEEEAWRAGVQKTLCKPFDWTADFAELMTP